MRLSALNGTKFLLDDKTSKAVWTSILKAWSNHDRLVLDLALSLSDLTLAGIEREVVDGDLFGRVAKVYDLVTLPSLPHRVSRYSLRLIGAHSGTVGSA